MNRALLNQNHINKVLPLDIQTIISKLTAWMTIISLFIALILITIISNQIRVHKISNQNIWSEKPILSYYVLTSSIIKDFSSDLGFSNTQIQIINQIAHSQQKELILYQNWSNHVSSDSDLSLEQKKSFFLEMGYNQEVLSIINSNNQQLKSLLNNSDYEKLVSWGSTRWNIEQEIHGVISQNQFPREYRIYAGVYDSRGAYYVALPDICVKTSNQNDPSCDQYGYVAGENYDVYVSYQGQGVAVRVGDVGPWNNDDNYWATEFDPTPRRMFTELPVGMPEAQAAYFDNYNDGNDQYGRKVIFPTGIEVSKDVAKDIGLAEDSFDWIRVAYLWTDDWEEPIIETPEDATKHADIILTSTEQPNGSISHIVEPGDSPLGIAEAYGLSVEELLVINKLTAQDVLQPGYEIIIKPPDRTAIPSWKLTATLQTQTSDKELATPTFTVDNSKAFSITESEANKVTPSPASELDQENLDNESLLEVIFSMQNIWYFLVALFLLFGIALVIIGNHLNNRN
jgi:LysM repeat protein